MYRRSIIDSYCTSHELTFTIFTRFASMPLSMENKQTNIEDMGKEPQVYEVGFHIIPTIAEDDLGVRVTAIRDVIESQEGKMIADEYPKLMDLMYPMVKIASNKRATYSSAYFGWLKFEVEPKGAKAIDLELKKDDNVLRFLLVKTVRESTMAPKKMFTQKRGDETKAPEEKVEETPMSEEELDKTIEELVIS